MIEYGSFEESGYKITAFMPSGDHEPREWYVTFENEGLAAKELRIPMLYAPIFGPDVADVAELEEKVDAMLKDLGGKP